AVGLNQEEQQVPGRNVDLGLRSTLRQHHLQADLFVEYRRREEEDQQKEGDVRHGGSRNLVRHFGVPANECHGLDSSSVQLAVIGTLERVLVRRDGTLRIS